MLFVFWDKDSWREVMSLWWPSKCVEHKGIRVINNITFGISGKLCLWDFEQCSKTLRILMSMEIFHIFAKDFQPSFRIASYFLFIHRPDGLIHIVNQENGTFLANKFSWCFYSLLLKIAGNFTFAQNYMTDRIENLDVFIFLFFAFIKQPLTSIGNVKIVQD